MKRRPLAVALALVCALAATPAHARHQKHHSHHHHISARVAQAVAQGCVDTNEGRKICGGAIQRITGHARVTGAYEGGAVLGGRPAGCPHAFCGCGLSIKLFGRIRPELNLAWNWARYFPRAQPAPRMAAVRRGHVMGLLSHVSGNDWLVYDANSGHGLIREHVRSIRGYVIVDPFGSRIAMR